MDTYSESPCNLGFKNALTSTDFIFQAKKFSIELCEIVVDYMSMQWLLHILEQSKRAKSECQSIWTKSHKKLLF